MQLVIQCTFCLINIHILWSFWNYLQIDASLLQSGFVFFQVVAKGKPDVSLPWLYDLQLGLAKLIGILCSQVLALKPGKASCITPSESSNNILIQL